MLKRQGVVLTTAHNVQAFLDANATLLGLGVTSARRNLDAATEQLTVMAKTQASSGIASKGATAQQHALVATLRNHYIRPVATVAKALLADAPEIGTMAVKTKGLTPTQLVSAAHGMADAAGQYADVFKQNGLPDDFITQIRGAADAVTAALNGRQQARATGSGAVSGMKQQEARVRSMIRVLDALVIPKLGSDQVLRTEWTMARAIESTRAIGRIPAAATPTAAAPAEGGTV